MNMYGPRLGQAVSPGGTHWVEEEGGYRVRFTDVAGLCRDLKEGMGEG